MLLDDPRENTLLTQEKLKIFSRNMHVCAQIDFRSSKRVSGQGTLSLETQLKTRLKKIKNS